MIWILLQPINAQCKGEFLDQELFTPRDAITREESS